MELPPESELCEPIRVSNDPSEPARLMQYIGLCGLLPVSLSRTGPGMIAPYELAAVPPLMLALMPRRKALSVWNESPQRWSQHGQDRCWGSTTGGIMSPGIPRLCCIRRCSGNRVGRPVDRASTFEPAILAPPARSIQMNGIFPAPNTLMPHEVRAEGPRSPDKSA